MDTLIPEPPNIFRVCWVGNQAPPGFWVDLRWAPQFPELQAAEPDWEGSQEHEVTPLVPRSTG